MVECVGIPEGGCIMQGSENRKAIIALFVAAATVLGACSSPTPIPTEAPTLAPTSAPAESTPTPEPPPAPGPTAAPEVGVPVIEPPAAGDPAAVANYNTFIFSGPGEDYAVYGAFLGGQQAKVVGISESGAWWAISVPPAPGGTGWVDGAWVTVTGAEAVPALPTPPVPATVSPIPPAAGDPQATALVNTYVRSGPGETFPAYGVAPVGAMARVIGKSPDGAWWTVRLDPAVVGAGYGWVSGSTVSASNVDAVPVIQPPAEPVAVPPAPPPAGAASATAVDYLYVRSGAGTCYAPYGTVAPGTSGEVAGKTADGLWWQVKIPTQYAASGLGWVSAGYTITANVEDVPVVDTEPCTEVPVPPPPTAAYSCFLSAQEPADGTQFGPEESFTMAWSLENTGTSDWTDAVLRYTQSGSGGPFHTGPDSIDIGTVSGGDSYTTSIPAMAPASAGEYGEVWEIVSGGEPVCGFWMTIAVAE
jgi:uncharacterized protein YgiM (DUF1202 family)